MWLPKSTRRKALLTGVPSIQELEGWHVCWKRTIALTPKPMPTSSSLRSLYIFEKTKEVRTQMIDFFKIFRRT